MKINEVIGEWIAMPHTAKSMGLRKANSHWMPTNVGNNKANEASESVPRLLGKAEASLMHGLELAGDVLAKDWNQATVRAEIIKQNWPGLIEQLKNVYKTNEGEAQDRAQHSIWRKNNPIGNNFMNPTDYDSDAPGTHIIMDNPTELHMYKVPAENYDQAFDKWLDGKNSENPRDHEFYDSTKDYASDHQYWGRIEPAQDPMNWPDAQQEEDAMGVGTITKQNTTQDVKPGETQRQAKKLHLR